MAGPSDKNKSSFGGEKNPSVSALFQFEKEFSHNHPLFLQKLSETFPELSPQELYICGMIRAKKNSSDIAGIFNIKIASVDNHRYHFRQKIGLKRNQNLEKFLLQL